MRLLVVEDQEHVLRLERMVLITDGFDVEIASGGREALEKLKSTRYDGVVLDMLMPEVDGCEVARLLKSIGLNRRTPVIMVTASLEPGMRQRAFEAGASAFLNKPFTAEGFRSAIRTAIASRPDAAAPMRPPPAVAPPPPVRPMSTPTPPPVRPTSTPTPPPVRPTSTPTPPPVRPTSTPTPPPVRPTSTPTLPPVRPTPTPTRTLGAGRAKAPEVVVRSETGGTYSCAPHPLGGWSCGRCELGLIITAHGDVPAVGSRCSICHAEVVSAGRKGGKRWWQF
jgi:CheY-like chemotaxis protein